MRVNCRDSKLIWNPCSKQNADGLSIALAGLRQRCSLSPLLYLIYDEAMIREETDNNGNWNFIGGRISNTIR